MSSCSLTPPPHPLVGLFQFNMRNGEGVKKKKRSFSEKQKTQQICKGVKKVWGGGLMQDGRKGRDSAGHRTENKSFYHYLSLEINMGRIELLDL